MASKKGRGNKKGKQPAPKRQVPQLSPPQSSSDEELWPVLEELQQKLLALEACRVAVQVAQKSDVQPHRSARETKGIKKTRLKAIVQVLMDRCLALEAAQCQEAIEESLVMVPRRWSLEKRRSSMPGMPEPYFLFQEGNNRADEVSPSGSQHLDDSVGASTSAGESVFAPNTQAHSAAWPWAGGVSGCYSACTPYATYNRVA